MLACPSCGRLVHSERLKSLAAEAESASDPKVAQEKYREILSLLPESSKQAASVKLKLEEACKAHRALPNLPKYLAGLGALGLFLWKFKFLFVGLLSKGKWVLMGLTKVKTLGSMTAFTALLGSEIGWALGLGLVVSIYLHEMGHVTALRKLGLGADDPLFVPGIGALVLLKTKPASHEEDAYIGLAGPAWGLVTAAICGAIYLGTESALWLHLTWLGAWINLFNLVPFWQLDGARGLRPLSTGQRAGLALLAIVLGFGTGVTLNWLIGLFILFRVRSQEAGSGFYFGSFALLLISLSLLSALG